jgi:predicted transcriptional regulator
VFTSCARTLDALFRRFVHEPHRKGVPCAFESAQRLLDRVRTVAIAKGEYEPKAGEPKIWFTSMKSVAEVLSDQNRAVLKAIRETNPDSMAVLAKRTGRQPGNLSRTLKTMSRYGLVDLQRIFGFDGYAVQHGRGAGAG